jgi:fibro-slime domain-containing protein
MSSSSTSRFVSVRVLVPLIASAAAAIAGCNTDPMVSAGPNVSRMGGSGGNAGGGAAGGGAAGGGGPGFTIPDAAPVSAACGNGTLDPAEGCDDGNTAGGDGCSAACSLESGFACPRPGQACEPAARCGNRVINAGEACDDGNTAGGDGCTGGCQLEAGWMCVAGGACKAARCGDGMKVGTEECDDGNEAAGDGCSPACFVEAAGPTESDGWSCPTAGQACVRTKCGNGMREGSEPCDDGNNDLGDGCTPFCRREPVCPAAGGPCNTVCGDGLLLPVDMAAGQACDDGNTLSGDGCSADCKLEQGYQCAGMPVRQDPLRLPIVYRDFKPFSQPGGHPDFERFVGMGEAGIVQPMLGSTGKPVHVAGPKAHTVNGDGVGGMGVDYFGLWYKDDPMYNRTIAELLTFGPAPGGGGGYQFSSFSFFPLDGRGFGNFQGGTDTGGMIRNFHFTSEVRHWFEYRGGERLDFRGDDDVWVFINKRLAVDLGGVHSALTAGVTLDATNGNAQVCDLLSPCAGGGARRTVNLGLQVGSVYEMVVFQAERRTDASNYQLTLSNFSGTRTSCKSVCGDGIATPDEGCDAGMANEPAPYGKDRCSITCTVAPYCGDGKLEPGKEDCDGGPNCTETCKKRIVD